MGGVFIVDNWRLFESGRQLDHLRDVSNYENPLWRNGTANRAGQEAGY